MFRVVILYPKSSDTRFDLDYYQKHHIPLVREIFKGSSLVKIEVDEGLANAFPDQSVPFVSISYFHFENIEDFQLRMAQRGGEIIGDMPNYTNVQPMIQIDRVANWAN
jgi:uncharacterized protein (TIGR02118 family)